MTIIKLVTKDRDLYWPSFVVDEHGEEWGILIQRYQEGDCDTIQFPVAPDQHQALMDEVFAARECGIIKDDDIVLLPDNRVI